MGQIYPGSEGEILCKVCHDKSIEHRPGPGVGVDTIKAESDKENLMTYSCKINKVFLMYINMMSFAPSRVTDLNSTSLVIIYFRKVVSDVEGKSLSQNDSKQNISRIIGSV